MSTHHPDPNIYDPVAPSHHAAQENEDDIIAPTPTYRDDHSAPPSPLQRSTSAGGDISPISPAATPIPGEQPSQRRFYGLALRDDGPQPYARDSYASAASTARRASSGFDGASLQALNATSEDVTSSLHRNASTLVDESPYRDDGSHYFPPTSPVQGRLIKEKPGYYSFTSPVPKNKKRRWVLIGISALLLFILVVIIPIYFTVVKKHAASTASSSTGDSGGGSGGGNGPGSGPSTPTGPPVSGGVGSQVTLEDGTTFTYNNTFGGYWYFDPNAPLTNAARAQSWSPALNETFNYGVDKIRGVNLGGWLTTEPFIAPALYEAYYNTSRPVDEWELTTAMKKAGNLADMEEHYKTFITEKDFADIAAAGLNFVRIPLPYWAIEVRDNEPFVPKLAWTYFLKAIEWARKYGIRINLDLHAVPGSQNGWNHSGRLGSINFMFGVAGIYNAQRTLGYLQVIAEFISQPQYRDVIPIFGILNEPRIAPIQGQDVMTSWYYEAYRTIRAASGVGEGKGPFISFHDGFVGPQNWVGIFTNADRVAVDTHPYIAFFQDQNTLEPGQILGTPCHNWGNMMNDSLGAFGLSLAGEFSAAPNDCGKWVHGVDQGNAFDGTLASANGNAAGNCDFWNDWQNWEDDMKTGIQKFVLSSMDALQNYFYWTWKIGNSSVTGKVEAPFWSYQLGLENGWIPLDPRDANGACASHNAGGNQFNGKLKSWQTGGAGADTVPKSLSQQWPWPPQQISAAPDVTLLPQYTPTGPNPTLPAPTFTGGPTGTTVDVGNGWLNPQDTQGAYVPIQGCDYPSDAWGGSAIAVPDACGGGSKKKRVAEAAPAGPTPPPPLPKL